MTEISIDQIQQIGQYWVVYLNEDGEPAHIQLSACANNFAIHRSQESGDGLKPVGLRYEKAGCDCYELFNVGHTLIKCPRSPGLGQTIAALFKGKKPAELQREKYEAVERQLNEFGWKTVAENP